MLPITKATSKNQHGAFPPSNLIDSVAKTFYHTIPSTFQPWVQLELQNEGIVHRVKITNRVDCCGERLHDLEVRVGNSEVTEQNQQGLSSNTLCGRFDGPGTKGEVVLIDCSEPIPGKYITLQIKLTTGVTMNIGEVQAFGTIACK